MEHKCLPNVRDKCPDCEGPECTYMEGSQCEKENLAYLHPDLWQELKAYRDTGLTPEEIFGLCSMEKRSRMAKMLRWEEAEKDGRLVVLPCKVTDTVYLIESILKGKKVTGEQVVSALIDHVTIGGTAGKPVFDICSATDNWYMALEPGEFFLTREEAEAELKKMKEADNETD